MNKRSKVSALAALGIAAAAVTTGAIVSGNAMAGSGDPADEPVSVTLISPSPDGSGDFIECTLDLEAGGVTWGTAVAPEPSDGGATPLPAGEVEGSFTVTAEGVVIGGDGTEVPIPVDDITIGESVQGTAGVGVVTGPGAGGVAQLIPIDDARQGTPEECAALTQVDPAP